MRFGAVVAGGVAAVVIGAVGFAAISDRGSDATPSLSPPSGPAFDEDKALPVGPSEGSFSPDGRRVAVLDNASVALASRGKLRRVTASNRIVDFAWMPNSDSVLVAEGPIPTGQVSVVTLDGKVKGTARLNPSIGFGTGYGMSVDATGTSAAVIAVDRDPIGGRERTDLAIINLTTGAVKRFATPEQDEQGPVFVDDDTIALSANGNAVIVDVATGTRRSMPNQSGVARVLGATDAGHVVLAESGVVGEQVVSVALDGSARKSLATLGVGERAVASDPRPLRILVVSQVDIESAAGGTVAVARLRAVDVEAGSARTGVEPG